MRAREGWGALGVPAFLSFVAVSHFKALKENMEGRGGRDPRGGKEPRASFLPYPRGRATENAWEGPGWGLGGRWVGGELD